MKKLPLLFFVCLYTSLKLFAQTDSLLSLNDFLRKNNLTTQTTSDGLHYFLEKKGDGPAPVTGDYALIRYRAMLTDSTVFDESEEGNPFVFQVGNHEVIKGLDKAILLLKKGSKATFFIPPSLGYQTNGVEGSVPPNAALIYEVELLDVMDFDQYDRYMRDLEERERADFENQKQAHFQKDLRLIEEYAAANQLKVKRTATGLSYVITKPGKGAPAKPGTRVTVANEGYLTAETLFYKSEKFEFVLGSAQVIQGWEEGLQFFGPGSEGWLLIPSKLGYGQVAVQKIPANAVLIFKIKLLKAGK
ncbi:MAG: FKBP-type peptidyl-prolyl cis-trans isomerase [Bacteroidetes bacterium]|nr:FKBP-type peptidyl-prolyl cis-trans isomerase [Bacteroidota bacterium]